MIQSSSPHSPPPNPLGAIRPAPQDADIRPYLSTGVEGKRTHDAPHFPLDFAGMANEELVRQITARWKELGFKSERAFCIDAKIHVDTIRGFRRRAKVDTHKLAKIEKALKWPPGRLTTLAAKIAPAKSPGRGSDLDDAAFASKVIQQAAEITGVRLSDRALEAAIVTVLDARRNGVIEPDAQTVALILRALDRLTGPKPS